MVGLAGFEMGWDGMGCSQTQSDTKIEFAE